MPNFCFVTGKKCGFGKSVSHSNNRTNRKLGANINKHKIYVSERDAFISVYLSSKGLRNIAKLGFFNAFKKYICQIKRKRIG